MKGTGPTMPEHGRVGDNRGNDFMAALTAAAREMSSSQADSESATLTTIASGAVDTVPGAEHAGVSLLHRDGSITSHMFSSEVVNEIDQLQATYREGPCVTALWDQHTVSVDDVSAESSRWPRFAPQAAAAGVASMLSFQLFTRENTLGALNLYSSRPWGFPAEAQTLGAVFAAHAAMALGQSQEVAQLHQAVATRDLIGQAKGILMERFNLTAEQAFSTLVRSSQDTNVKLNNVARWLTENDSDEGRLVGGQHGNSNQRRSGQL